MNIKKHAAWLTTAALVVCPMAALAQDPQPESIAKIWTFIPKNGDQAGFEKAFAEHVQWRRDNKDPWHWDVYVQVDGPEVGAYYARSGNHSWADFDAYDASEFVAKASDHWTRTVSPHLDDIHSSITRWLPALSNWPDDAPIYNLFQLQHIQIKPGHMRAYTQAVGTIADALKQAKWPYHWGLDAMMSGGEGPSVTLVLPSMKWADMAEPKPNFYDTMAGVIGEEKAAKTMADLNATVATTKVTIVRRIPELEVKAAK